MERLEVSGGGAGAGSKISSRSGSPGLADLAHHESLRHHTKSHSRDLTRDNAASAHRESEESPKRIVGAAAGGAGGEHGPLSPAGAYILTAEDFTSPHKGAVDTEYSLQYQSSDDADGSASGGGGQASRTATAIAHLNSKIARTRELIRLEQTIRDDNVNEYLKLAASADKQQLQRIKAVFEKKNQKSAHCIAQLQKKLDGYHKRITNWETHGSGGGQGAHRQPREVLRDMSQGLKNMGGNIRDGITGLGGSVMAAPREFAHMFTRASRFGSADNISQLAGSRASDACGAPGEGTEGARGATLPRATAASPQRREHKSTPDDASPCSSVTSESGPYRHRGGSNNLSEVAYSIKPILSELRERREDYERLAERLDAVKGLSGEVAFLSSALQEERFRTERLEEQVNDLTELHQNEMENLKQALTDVEEKVQYQSEERIRDIHEALDLAQTKISKLEHMCLQAGVTGGAAGGGGDPAHGNLPPRVILVKLLNVALTLLQLVLLLAATVAGIAMPFLRTRVRVLTTSLAVLAGVVVLKQWPEVALLSAELFRRWRLYLDPPDQSEPHR